MKLNKISAVISATAVATIFNLLGVAKPVDAATIQLIGLNDNNTLVFFKNNFSEIKSTVSVTNIDGTLLGIDFRPADGLLYSVSSTNKIYTIDIATGLATQVSSLNLPFTGGITSGVDFNPVPDRLRLVGSNDQNFRINVDNGAVADNNLLIDGIQPDGTLAYGTGDVNFGANPSITAAAYTNSFAGPASPTRTTQLFNIDSNLDVLVRQGRPASGNDPAVSPNSGQLFTVGSLNADFGSTVGFDIFSPANGVNTAYAASGSNLYNINLNTGAATTIGTFNTAKSGNIIGLAATQVPEPAVTSSLIGFGVLALVSRNRRRKLSN